MKRSLHPSVVEILGRPVGEHPELFEESKGLLWVLRIPRRDQVADEADKRERVERMLPPKSGPAAGAGAPP